jgi:hypothetical protein
MLFFPVLWIGIVLMQIRIRIRLSILMSRQIRIPTASWKIRFLYFFIFSEMPVYIVPGVIIFSILDSILKIIRKKVLQLIFTFRWNRSGSASPECRTRSGIMMPIRLDPRFSILDFAWCSLQPSAKTTFSLTLKYSLFRSGSTLPGSWATGSSSRYCLTYVLISVFVSVVVTGVWLLRFPIHQKLGT